MPLETFLHRFFARDNDSHDTPTPDNVPLLGVLTHERRGLGIVSRWRDLDQLDPESQDYFQLFNSLLDNDMDRKATTSLEGEDSIVVLDILAKTLERGPNPGNRSNHTLRVLRNLAYNAGQVPNRYKIDRSLSFGTDPVAFASGGFSDVWRGDLGGRLVAVKILRMAQNSDVVELQKRFCKEAVLWKNISHPNILGLIAADIDNSTGRCLMVSELMVNGNIFSFIQRNSVNRLRLLADVAEGLQFLHDCEIFHGDIKGQNILITNATPPRACLCDFGFSVPVPTKSFPISTCGMNTGGGTPPYMAPEIMCPSMFGLSRSKVSREGDIFAFGMAMYEVVAGIRPLGSGGKRAEELIFVVMNGGRPEKPENAGAIGFGNGIWDLMEKCWSQDRRERPSTSDVRMRLTVAASMSAPVPFGPRVAVPLAQDTNACPTISNSYAKLFNGVNDKGAVIELDGSSDEGAHSYTRLISLDHPVVERSITVARQVVGGIHASISPTVRRGFGMLQRLPIRRFIADFRTRFNFGSPRLHRG